MGERSVSFAKMRVVPAHLAISVSDQRKPVFVHSLHTPAGSCCVPIPARVILLYHTP